jgi:A nuclease family of the HNH/ENDO VII superfamily with conserved AHH
MKFSKTVLLTFFTMLCFTTYWSCKKETILTNENSNNTSEASIRALCTGEKATNYGTCPIYRQFSSPIVKSIEVTLKLGKQVCAAPANAVSGSSTQCVWWMPKNGSIEFSSYSDLADVIGPGTGQAHHIIPKQLCDDFVTTAGSTSALHAVVKTAAYDGFHPNDGYNGIRIPSANHTGNHPAYTAWVKSQLELFKVTKNNNYTAREANKWIQCKLIPKIRDYIALTIATNNPVQNINTYFGNPNQVPNAFIGL